MSLFVVAGQTAIARVMDATTMIEFDLVKGTTGQLIATYTKNPDGSWSGLHPTTRAPATWRANAKGHSMTLFTDGPPMLTLVVDTDSLDVTAGALDPAGRYMIGRAVFQ